MRIMVLGDTHGNGDWIIRYVYPVAAKLNVDAIVQCGDFGFWEHEPSGVRFLDQVGEAAGEYGIPMYALRGNHDKWSLVLRTYTRRTPNGFLPVRPGIYAIPDGHIWTWHGVRMRAFGGAYSLDKDYRLNLERKRYRSALAREEARRAAGHPPQSVLSTAGSLWFPEEEISDFEFERLLDADSRPVDVIFSHDKPASSTVRAVRLSDVLEARHTQQWLQRALVRHHPRWWFHGHLHIPYVDTVRAGSDGAGCRVVGLGSEPQAAIRFQKPWHAWCLLNLDGDGAVSVTSGADGEASLEEDPDDSDEGDEGTISVAAG